MINVGDLLAILRLRDEMSGELRNAAANANVASSQISASLNNVTAAGNSIGPAMAGVSGAANTANASLGNLAGGANAAAGAIGGGGGAGGAGGGGGGAGGGGLFGASSAAAYQLTLLGRGLKEVGVLATGAFTVPILGAADAVIKFSSGFETQMTRVITLAGATREEVDSLRAGVLALAPATGIGADELAKGLFVLESYGLRGAKAMDTLTIAAKMSSLGMGETSEIARGLTGVLFSYKEQNLSAAQAGDLLTKTVQLGNMKINELVPAMAKLNPVAAAMGIKFEDVAAAIATFTHAGVDSSVATTGLRAALGNILVDSAKTEKGFKALALATGDASITMVNFKKDMAERGMTAAMIDLANSANSAGEAGTKALASIFPNIRALTEILGVYKINGDMVVKTLHDLKDAHGTVENGVKELAKTWEFQWNSMLQELRNVAIELGQSLMPVLKSMLAIFRDDIIPIIKGVIQVFNMLPREVQETAFFFTALLAVLGPGLMIFGQIALAIGNISRATLIFGSSQTLGSIATMNISLSSLIPTTANVAAAFRSMFNLILAHPFFIVVAAISTATLAYVNLKNATADAALAAETAAAKHDTIVLAIQRGARIVDDATKIQENYTKALQFNTEWLDRLHNPLTKMNSELGEMRNNGASAAEQANYLAFRIHTLSNEGQLGSDQMKEIAAKAVALKIPLEQLDPALRAIVVQYGGLSREALGLTRATETVAQSVTHLTEDQKVAIQVGQKNHENAKQILEDMEKQGIATGVTSEMISLYERQMAAGVKQAGELAKAKEIIRLAAIPLTDAQKAEINQMETYNVKIGENIIGLKTMALETGAAEVQVKRYLETQRELNKVMAEVHKIEHGGDRAVGPLGGSFGLIKPDPKFGKILEEVHKIEFGGDKAVGPLGGSFGLIKPEHLKNVDTYGKSIAILATEFTKLGQIAGGSLADVFKYFGALTVQLEAANKMTQQIGGSAANLMLGKEAKKIGGDFGPLSVLFSKTADGAQKASAAIATAAAIYQGANAIWDATAAHATAAGNALGGMAAGAQAGAAFGPWGMAIGAAAGLVVGIIRGKPEWAKAADEVANDFGVKISDKLAKTIADEGKTLFHGSSQASAISHLSDIIKEAGGLSEKNLPQMTARLHDVFSMIETHQMTIEQGMKVLDDNWSDFAKAGTDATGRISAGLKEIIRLDQEFGTNSKAIAEWMGSQGAKNLDYFLDTAKAITKPITDAADAFDKLSDEEKKTSNIMKNLGIDGKRSLDDLSSEAVRAYAVAVASGMSSVDAMAKLHPVLADIKKSYEALGIPITNAAIKSLILVDTITSRSPELISGIAGLTGQFTILDNMGLMTKDTFAEMERTGHDMYAHLLNDAIDATGGYDSVTGAVKDADGATRLALGQMQAYLHAAVIEAENLGVPLDDNTQILVDQSKALGIWKDVGKSAMDKLIDKINELIDTLSGKLKPAIDNATKPVPAPWKDWQLPDVPELDHGTRGEGIPMAAGGDFMVTKPTLFLAGEAGPERAFFSGANKTNGPAGSGETTNTSFVVIPVMPRAGATPQEIVDNVIDALPAHILRGKDGIRTRIREAIGLPTSTWTDN